MNWTIIPTDAAAAASLGDRLGLSPFLAGLLAARGLTTPAEAAAFLDPKLSDFENPLSLPGLAVAADRICAAISRQEKVIVYGDYDVDGITSVSLLVSFLRQVGLEATPVLPSRFVDGYGLNMERAREAVAAGCRLLITVDCGSTAVEEVEYLTGEGVDVIVTDHHKVRPPLPRAVALINPDAWEQLPQYASLAGVGVAFLLLIAVHIKLKDDPARRALLPPLKSCLDLVTLGTVADMVPLRGPSRTLVYHGLKLMDSRPPRPGIIALREVAGQADKRMDTSAIAFYLAPRINAAGRLGSAETGLELMMARSLAEAMPLARRLDKDNAQRREVEAAIFEEAQAMTEAILTRQDRHVIVLASPQWHKGVLGIVASKICEKFRKPSILLAIEDCTATGSGRSVPGFDLAAALDRCSEILLKYGGHSMAAGLTLEAARLDDLAERLELAAAELLPREAALPTLPIEAFVALRDVDHRMLQDLERLVPFGAGNPEPTIAVAGVTARRCQLVGGGDHLKFAVEQEGRTIEAIAFKLADKDVRAGDLIDVAFFPEINSWGGLSQIQLRVKDIRKPSQMAGRGEGRA